MFICLCNTFVPRIRSAAEFILIGFGVVAIQKIWPEFSGKPLVMRPFCFNHSIVITGQRRELAQLHMSAVISVSPDIFYRIRHQSTCPVEQQLFLSIAIYIVQSKIHAFLSIGIRHSMICSLDLSETICIPQDFAKRFCLFLCRKRFCPINCKNAIISAYGSRIGSILPDVLNSVS